MHRRFWYENFKERNYLGYTCVNGRITLKWFLKTKDGRVWVGFFWLRIRTNGRLL
jgi:hypothetical protein